MGDPSDPSEVEFAWMEVMGLDEGKPADGAAFSGFPSKRTVKERLF